MVVVRSSVLVAAAPRTVAGVLRDVDVLAAGVGRPVEAAGRWLVTGDEVRIDGLPAVRVGEVSPSGMRLGWDGGEYAVALTAAGGTTRMAERVRWSGPPGPDAARRLLAARTAAVVAAAVVLAAAPVVVATALVRDDTVLAAQRTRPPGLAGLWELPGGRVEAGESEAAAVVRECREELGTDVVVDGRLATDLRIDAGVLRVHAARLADGAPAPRALEHSGLRWVTAAEVPGVDWVPADRAVVADLVDLLRP
ncbi:(deoxy)nucleoside triphosphate pyrophosphohydrolase [Pseudonocardia hydrocarbonoxydans]|uniref:8-oxo-dGTP diphosphatase n=1 Tax=Pseudonocardia hydrocarbonoxydans TaxID=76726 RepID=A0A4Y3WPC9_9PSEU|nr:NUDIX domain-containing protein [Pseudonocardia hydrocarbonoxydans]GEC20713.1 hypothetical protein PHY01_29960 [Pseudonocardia hydrocarbonoxydans]